MIIRATVYDNDYTNRLEDFFRDLSMKVPFYSISPKHWKSIEQAAWCKLISKGFRFREMICPDNFNGLHNKKCEILTLLIEMFGLYYSGETLSEIKTYAYLRGKLELQVVDAFKDEWENGEAVYYFLPDQMYVIR